VYLAIVAFVTPIGIACSGQAHTVDASRSPNSVRCQSYIAPHQERSSDTVRRLDLTWGKRWASGDVAFLDCLYDPTWHYVTPKAIIDKKQDLAQSRRFAATHHNFEDWPIVSVRVYLDGDFAASSGLTQSPDGKHVRRWTDYFLWDGFRWHAAFSQSTPVR
jgi:hypothetical protein